ncbi:MAG: hypothetical protein P8M30_08820 [Planctomycetaceae bacterium]|nr:hypothetical protein [bacterium]MDG2389407.1 hypothetical protein [Planctomycetaceae bacterium]
MTIKFNCGGCGKSLKASEDKAGKTGKCPDCGEPILVPLPERSSEPENPFTQDESPYSFQAAPKPTEPCPMCGTAVPSSASSCPACGESIDEQFTDGGFTPGQKIRVGEVLNSVTQSFSHNFGLAVGGLLMHIVNTFGISIVGGMGLFASFTLVFISPILTVLAAIIVYAAIILANIWLSIGIIIFFLKLIRNQRAQITDLYTGSPFLGRTILCNLLLAVISLAIAIPGVIIMIAAVASGEPALFAVGYFVIGIGSFIVSLMLMWSVPNLIDLDCDVLTAVSNSRRMMSGNYLSVILLGIIGMAALFVGALLFGFGLIVAIPFVMMLYATTYNHLCGGQQTFRENY